jgi:hypothetical protein
VPSRKQLAAAAVILRCGFRDAAGGYMTDQKFSGVWLSDRPLDANEGVSGDAVLAVNFFHTAHRAGRL